ncbi:MAG: hypothetical protein II600_04125, partial [Bacteroidaceae bacterium]|nr:hypothetical protein [Bacteroidaceae bacterium]
CPCRVARQTPGKNLRIGFQSVQKYGLNKEEKHENVYFSKKNAESFSFSAENQYLCTPILIYIIIKQVKQHDKS